VFSNGRQVDLLMTDADSYKEPLKCIAGKSRSAQWNRVFGGKATVERIERAAAPGTAFADDAVSGLCFVMPSGAAGFVRLVARQINKRQIAGTLAGRKK
jgi:hypothetical protein